MSRLIISALGSLASLSAIASTGSATHPLPSVGVLELGSDYDTPTCHIARSDGDIFAHEADFEPVMKLDGKLVRFQLDPKSKSLWDFHRPNERIRVRYRSGNLVLKIRGQVTQACTPEIQGCEYTQMSFTATLSNGTRSKVMRGLTGGCGV